MQSPPKLLQKGPPRVDNACHVVGLSRERPEFLDRIDIPPQGSKAHGLDLFQQLELQGGNHLAGTGLNGDSDPDHMRTSLAFAESQREPQREPEEGDLGARAVQ